MNNIPLVSMELHCNQVKRLGAYHEATQAGLMRILAIADYILQHPKVSVIPFEMHISGGFEGAFFVVNSRDGLEQARLGISVIAPSSHNVRQGSALTCTYFDSLGSRLPDPDNSDAREILRNLTGEKVVPDRLRAHLDSLDT